MLIYFSNFIMIIIKKESPRCYKYKLLLEMILVVFSFLFVRSLSASESDIIDLAISYKNKGEYYNSITEIFRYQYLYPNGKYNSKSYLILGDSYFNGGNYYSALNAYTSCYDNYKNNEDGETALLKLGYIRLLKGSPYFAYRSIQEYRYLYKNGIYIEDIDFNSCFAKALMNDLDGAEKDIKSYINKYPRGRHLDKINDLKKLINNENNKTKKSLWISVAGSIFIPGFGHFYTGKYSTGILSFLSNAVLTYLFYDAYRARDTFRMIIFGICEFSFYQYSLYSAISNVHEYNSRNDFYKSVRLSLSKNF